MPCDTVQTSVVEWSEKTSSDRLFEALQEMKLSPQWSSMNSLIYFRGGQYNVKDHALTINAAGTYAEQRDKEIRKAYAGSVAKFAFKQAGWQISTAPVQQTIMMRR